MVNRFSYRRRGSKNVRRSTRRRRSGRRKSLFEGLIKMNRRGRRMIFNRKGRWGVAERLRRFGDAIDKNHPDWEILNVPKNKRINVWENMLKQKEEQKRLENLKHKEARGVKKADWYPTY